MTAGNDPAAWQSFYVMIGTANAAITGLLFVALSIHLKEILEHPVFKPRAVVVLIVLTTQIIVSAIALSPQPVVWMGSEIMAINLVFLYLNFRFRARAKLSAGLVTTIAVRVIYGWSALSLIIGFGGGFYILGLSLLVTLARSMSNCWTLLTALDLPTGVSHDL